MFSIAIDGPAGAGKSSIARALAKALGFVYVDTGALYRTVALYLLEQEIDPKNTEAVCRALPQIKVEMEHHTDGQHVLLCGRDVTDKIRTQEVSMMASASSGILEVRDYLLHLQTEMAERYDVIMDGRDIGTVVLPNAQVKVFLTASPEVRAKRRYMEYQEKGVAADYDTLRKEIIQRDEQDANRPVRPLKPAADAVILDTSDMEFNAVITAFQKIVAEKRKNACG